jgi:hypothetical protein
MEHRVLDKTLHAPARARLRSLRDASAASMADSDPLASELLALAAVVLGRLNGRPTFFIFPPAEGLTILEGEARCAFPADTVGDVPDEEIGDAMKDLARSAVRRGLVLPKSEAWLTG